MGRPVVHLGTDVQGSGESVGFLCEALQLEDQKMGGPVDYRMVETGGDGGINGGILKPEREGPWPGNMLFYIDVDDLAAYRKIVAAGSRSRLSQKCGHGQVLAVHRSRGTHDGTVGA